ncbi:glycosyltransferase family 2 protein [Sulfurimonas microaerophilic]|uniref:glycosyltransferase family 2 protein n=1 Tax=Sulfurimonas microaerophilic TaxID=3058392 RepID=UPI0027154CA9|nr:glycosyltransferase family 2 protein [Sulfurimonas sp. hsl 1-7]
MSYTSRLVSVAIATYNGEKYLRKQLDSIYNQTYQNIEVIVCDDCSDDNTINILEEYSKKYNLIYYLNEYNLGYVKNFEKAISLCNGDYIALSDQDDIWLPQKLEVLVEEIDKNSVIHSDAFLIDNRDRTISDSWTKFYKKNTNTEMIKCIFGENDITGCTCMITKEFVSKIIPFPKEFKYHDMWIAMVGINNGGIKYIDKPLIMYRLHENNVIGANTKEKKRLNSVVRKEYYLNFLSQCIVILHQSNLLKLDQNSIRAVIDNILMYSNRYNSFINLNAFKYTFKYYKYLFPRDTSSKKLLKILKLFIGNRLIALFERDTK